VWFDLVNQQPSALPVHFYNMVKYNFQVKERPANKSQELLRKNMNDSLKLLI